MRVTLTYPLITHVNQWVGKVQKNKDSHVVALNSNEPLGKNIVAIGCSNSIIKPAGNAFSQLKNFWDKHQDWMFGYLSYDLKNEVENLESSNFDGLKFPELLFFQPTIVVELFPEETIVHFLPNLISEEEVAGLVSQVASFPIEIADEPMEGELKSRISREEYITAIRQLKDHIQFGDIYEINFCQEFFLENINLEPAIIYNRLNDLTKAPFSVFFKANEQFLFGGSPERFMKKEGNRLTSQPIKGTIRRGETVSEDEQLKKQLFNDPKERGENVMIVDLVRNDLSKTAEKGSVQVEELFGIYSFETVHQMISTVTSKLKNEVHFIDAIREAFPMGSMTGAPKVRAMELIEKYESTKRGLYSGAIGYISPKGDFDFNVVIRSVIYNAESNYVSMMAGGAITALSEPEKEYEESMLKAKALFQALKIVEDGINV